MTKEEIAETKVLLQRLKDEVVTGVFSQERERAALEDAIDVIESLPRYDNHYINALLLGELIRDNLSQMDSHLYKLKENGGIECGQAYDLHRYLSEIEEKVECIHDRVEWLNKHTKEW